MNNSLTDLNKTTSIALVKTPIQSPTMAHLVIFVIEDNDALRKALCDVLSAEGHMCMGLSCAEDLDDEVMQESPDLYLIDLNLPGEDGLSLTRRLRQSQPDARIVVLTARTEINDRLRGYEEGADLYFAKPIHPQELCAVVASLGKRLKERSADMEHEVRVQTISMTLHGPVGESKLTGSELKLIEALSRAPGQTLQSWQVATHLGKGDTLPSKASVEVRLSRIRRKLTDVGAPTHAIKALHGYGYKLCVPVQMVQR